MCDPVSIGAALMVAGTGAQIVGNNQAKSAVRNALAMEQQNQDKMTRQQDAAWDQSLTAAKGLNDQASRDKVVDHRKQAFIDALNTRPAVQGALPGAESQPAVVQGYAERANAGEQADMTQQATALANMTGFGDQLLDTQVGRNRAGDTIAQVARDKAQSARILDNELVHAQSKGGTLRGIGGLASMIGSMMVGGNVIGGAGGAARMPVSIANGAGSTSLAPGIIANLKPLTQAMPVL